MTARAADRVLVVSGPSGVGKGTVIDALLQRHPDIHLAVSATTRPPRAGETDGVHYHFLTDDEFAAALAAGQLAEHATYAGNSYGTLHSELVTGRPTLVECELAGAMQLRDTLPAATFAQLHPPSRSELERRLRGRGTDSDEVIARRLARADIELAHANHYDHIIVNRDVEQTVSALARLFD